MRTKRRLWMVEERFVDGWGPRLGAWGTRQLAREWRNELRRQHRRSVFRVVKYVPAARPVGGDTE